MKYKVYYFRKKGLCIHATLRDTNSHLKAVKSSIISSYWTHAVVVGKTVKRYDRKLRLIQSPALFFKTSQDKKFSILAMFDNIAEIFQYENAQERDSVLEEVQCINSTSAGSAKTSPAQTAITVSIAETSDSESGLTFPKISNGSVTNVTCWDLLTHTSIGKFFGKDNAENLERPTWRTGSTASRSKRQRSFLATVKNLESLPHPIYASHEMYAMKGQTIWVKKSSNSDILYYGEFWTWHKSYLDFRNVYATLNVNEHVNGFLKTPLLREINGETLPLHPCENHYSFKGHCIPAEWLKPASENAPKTMIAATVKNVSVGTMGRNIGGGFYFVEDMRRFVGKTLVFEKVEGCYKYSGYKFHKSWLKMEDTWENSGKKQNEGLQDSWVVCASRLLGAQEETRPTLTTIDIPSKSSTEKTFLTGSWALSNRLTRLKKKIAKLPFSR